MFPSKARLAWIHLGASVVCVLILAAFASAEEPYGLQMAAGPNWGGAAAPTKPAPSVPAKAAPAVAPQAPPGKAAVPQPSVPVGEPRWPQPFELIAGERSGFGFVVGKPGPIFVNVQWTGVPLIVSLAKPGGGMVTRQGNGKVSFQYLATAEDVKKGMLWSVGIQPAHEAPKPGGKGVAVIDRPVKVDTKGVAKGSVAVQHPPGDMKLAQAEWKARADNLQAAKPQPAPAATSGGGVLAQKQAALQKQQGARQAALLEQVKTKIPVQAYQKMSQRISTGAKSASVSGPSYAVTGGSADPVTITRQGARTALDTPIQRDRIVSTSQSAEVTSAGSNAPATVVSKPAISSLSITSGQPGDPVLISGNGFSNDGGEVHFIIASGKDVKAQPTFWSDTQIFASVPDASGIPAYNGQIYVMRGTEKSGLVPFRFIPATEIKRFQLTPGHAHIQMGDGEDKAGTFRAPANGIRVYHRSSGLLGHRGDDAILENYRLKNGWVLDSVEFLSEGGYNYMFGGNGGADAYLVQAAYGTDAPAIRVHWWNIAFCAGNYGIAVIVRGPRGVPYE